MIAGTSTGGILALGLGMGLGAADILSFYVDRGPTIFPMTSLTADPVTGVASKGSTIDLSFLARSRAPVR
jgi:patatin-like phospholipase/acyl hydrolase